jgi:hypothetical protein
MSDRRSDSWNTDKITSSNEWVAAQARLARFRMFFAGLIFAVVSFIGTHAVEVPFLYLKFSEIASLGCLLISGILLLVRISETRFEVGSKEGLCFVKRCRAWLLDAVFNRDRYYWGLFILGMVLLVINRSILLLCS